MGYFRFTFNGTYFIKSLLQSGLSVSPLQKRWLEILPLTGGNLEQDQAHRADAELVQGGGEERQMGEGEEHIQTSSLRTY